MEFSLLKSILSDVDDEDLEMYHRRLTELAVKTKDDAKVLKVEVMQPIPFCHAQRVLNYFNEMETPSSAVRRKRPLEASPLNNFTLPLAKVPSNLHSKLVSNRTFSTDDRKSFVNFLAAEITYINASPSKPIVDKIARDIVQQYPSTFVLKDAKGNLLTSDAADVLSQYVRNRCKNEYAKGKKSKKELFPVDNVETAKIDEEELENIRKDLKSQHHRHDHKIDDTTTETVSLMKKTYSLRRKNVKALTNQQVMEDWPCLFSSLVILDQEFEMMTGVKVEISVTTARNIVEHIKGKPKYKKNVNEANTLLEKVICREENFLPYNAYVYMFLIKVFQDCEENIFQIFPEETPSGEIINAVRLPTPTVIVRGVDIFKPKHISILFEKRMLLLPLFSFGEAMHVAFKLYHVLCLKYAEKTENYWDFFEVFFCGGMQETRKRAPKAKVLSFVSELSAAQ